MTRLSRRAIAVFAAERLLDGAPSEVLAKHLAAALAESGRTAEAELLINDIAWELERRQELVVGRVTTAEPLAQELHLLVSSLLKNITGAKEVLLEPVVDKSTLGGIKIETSAKVWDRTLARKLGKLKEAF